MRLVVDFVLCTAMLIVAGCQPENVKVKEEPKVDEVKVAKAMNPAKTNVAPTSQDTSKNSTNLPTASKWKSMSAEQRGIVAQQLISEELLIGLSEDAVGTALGKPNQRFEQVLYYFHVDIRLRPDIIPGMIVNFGKNGLVQKVGGAGYPAAKIHDFQKFDKDKWMDSNDYDRLSMAQSVWGDKVLNGKNRAQVYETLGEPSKTLPIMLLYNCDVPVALDGKDTQNLSKTLSIWLENDSVIRARIMD